MKISAVVVALSCLSVVVACSSARDGSNTGSTTEEGLHVCPLMEVYCPPDCHQTGGGCPVQCHCPGYVACGPTLHCGVGEVCCTGPGPVNIDPSLNTYSCNPAGTVCPL